MQPSLLPDLAHLPVTLSVFGVALLAIGLGALAGARRAETALVSGWGIAAFVTVLAGTFLRLPLPPVMVLLCLAGLGGLGWAIVSGARGEQVLEWGMAGRVAVLAVPLLLLTEGAETVGWDDFAQWLPNLAYLCQHGHFPTLAEPSLSYHAGYPTALALPGYASWLVLRRLPESAALTWNLVLVLAAGTCVARIIRARLVAPAGGFAAPGRQTAGTPHPATEPRVAPEACPATEPRPATGPHTATEPPAAAAPSATLEHRWTAWAAASAGLLLAGLACPTFVPKIFFSNMADAATASVLAVMGALVFQWWNDAGSAGRARLAFAFGLCGAVLMDLRQANVALFLLMVLGAGLGMVWQGGRRGVGAWSAAIIALPVPLLTWALWGHYTAAEIPGGEMPVLPFAHWHWAEFPSALANMGRVALAKTGLFSIIVALSVRALLALRRDDALVTAQRGLLLAAVAVCLGNVVFLAFAYLAVGGFSREEVAAAASFWRYASQTGSLAVLAVVVVMPAAWARVCRSGAAAAVLIGLVVVLPVAAVTYYRPDWGSGVPALRGVAEAVDRAAAPGQAVDLVDLGGNGFAALVAKYQMTIADAWPGVGGRPVSVVSDVHGLAADDTTRGRLGAPYVWLAEATPEADLLFGQELRAGWSYLFRREGRQFTVVQAWPVR